MNTSFQFVQGYVNFTKIPLDAYLDVIAQFICRETLMTNLLWLVQLFHRRRNLHISTHPPNFAQICNLNTLVEPRNIYKILIFGKF